MEYILHLVGLPYAATQEEIVNFLTSSPDDISEIQICEKPDGRANGEAFAVFTNEDTAVEAVNTKHKKVMQGYTRYIEIEQSDRDCMIGSKVSERTGLKKRKNYKTTSSSWDGVIKMRGLPYSGTLADVEKFFAGLVWTKNGITVPLTAEGISSGEAFVQFANYTSANAALERHKRLIGERYIDLCKSSNNDRRVAMIRDRKARQTYGPDGNKKFIEEKKQTQVKDSTQVQWGGLNISATGPIKAGLNLNNMRQMPYGSNNMSNMMQQNNPTPNMPAPNMQASNMQPSNMQLSNMQPPNMQSPNMQAPNMQAPNMQAPNMGQNTQAGPPTIRPKNDTFPHKVMINGLAADTPNAIIQKCFSPLNPIAINNHKNGCCELAFKNHNDALMAMEKHNTAIGSTRAFLTLFSTPAVKMNDSWSSC